MALTMAGSSVDAWAVVAQNAMRIGTPADVNDCYHSVLHLDMALGTTTAHTGSRVIVQLSSSTADNEFWTTAYDFIALVGTANTETILDAPLAAAATLIHVADLTGFTVATGGSLLALIIDNNTVADSELVRITSTSVEAGNDHINIMDATKREHTDAGTPPTLSNVAAQYIFELPIGTLRARVLYDNLYDADGSTVYTRTRVVQVTAL